MDVSGFYLIGSLLVGFGLGYFISDKNSKKLLDLKDKNSDRDKEFENAFKAIASDIAIPKLPGLLGSSDKSFFPKSVSSDGLGWQVPPKDCIISFL